MKSIVTILLLLFSITSFSQKDTTYYFGVNGRMGLKNIGLTKKIIQFNQRGKIKIYTSNFDKNSWKNDLLEVYTKVEENTYLISSKSGINKNFITRRYSINADGINKFSEYVDGKVKRIGFTKKIAPLILQGEVTEYYSNGNKKSVSVYNNNELVSNKNWLENGAGYINNIFYSVDENPKFILGEKYLQDHILRTFRSDKVDLSNLSGEIVIGFVVLENGQINGLKIIKGINMQLDTITLNSFSSLMGRWDPAILNGEKVNYFQTYPVNFISNEIKFDNVELNEGRMNWTTN